MNTIIKKIAFLSIAATSLFSQASDKTVIKHQGNTAIKSAIDLAGNTIHYGLKATKFAVNNIACPIITTGLQAGAAITSNPYTFALAGLTVAYGGWRYHRWKQFNAVAGDDAKKPTARWFASRPRGTSDDLRKLSDKENELDEAIDTIRSYADGADEIDGSIGINYVLPEYDPKTKYAPKTNIIKDVYRSFRPAEHVMRKTAWEIARPLVWVNSREASALLVQLRDLQMKIAEYKRNNPQVSPTIVINNTITQRAR